MTRSIRVLNGRKKAGFHSGRMHASNIIAGKIDITLGSGDGTGTVTFAKALNNAKYRVLLTSQEATTNDDLVLSVTTKTPQSFVINVNSTNHSTPITIGYLVLADRNSAGASYGRFGFSSGHAHFRNMQWGKAVVTIGAGSGTALTIKLTKPMKNKPLIFLSFDDDTAVTAGFAYIATGGAQNNGSFKIDVESVSGPSGTVDVTWLAFDPGFNFGSADAIANSGDAGVGGNRQAKFGIHSGDFRAKNFIGGIAAMTADGNGDQTEAVTFGGGGQMLRQSPVVLAMIQSPVNDDTAVAFCSAQAISGITVGVNNSKTTTAGVVIAYLAIDYEWRATDAAE